MTENKELLIPLDFDDKQEVALFTDKKPFDDLLAKIKAKTDAFKPDITSNKGRDEVRALAYKVTRTKTTLDELGKNVKDEAQKTVDAVDASRKNMRESLDALKEEVRKPLTDYEDAEKERIALIKDKLSRIALLKQIPFDASSQDIIMMIGELKELKLYDEWAEFSEEAGKNIDDTYHVLKIAAQSAKQREDMAEANAKLEAEKAELEAKRLAQEQVEAEERAANEERRRIEQEASDKAAREQAEKIAQLEADKAKAEQEAQEATQRERQTRIDQERQTKEIAEAKERDEARQKQEAIEAEAERVRVAKEQKAEAERLRIAEEQRIVNAKQMKAETIADLAEMHDNVSQSQRPENIAEGYWNCINNGKIRHVELV